MTMQTRRSHSHTIAQEIKGILIFVAVIWAVFLLNQATAYDLNSRGLQPRSRGGLVGIATMPFLHADLSHIVSNTTPLFVLLLLLAGSNSRTSEIVMAIIVVGGGFLWIPGRSPHGGGFQPIGCKQVCQVFRRLRNLVV